MRAIEAGKHVYPEKPAAESLQGALRLARAARAAGVTHGMVHDKLFLPGVIKLRRPRMLRKVWGYFDAAGPLVGVTWPIRYRWSDQERVAHLEAMGVRLWRWPPR